MSEKLRVSGKTIPTEKQRTFVNRSSGNRVDVARRTQLYRRFDVTSRSFTGSARLDARLDQTADVVEMIDDGFGKGIRERLSSANYVITGLQIERACRVCEQLCIADDHGHANSFDFIFSNCLEDNFGPNPGRVSHGNADARQNPPGSRSRVS